MRRSWGSCACGVHLRGQAQGGNLPVIGSDSQNGVGSSAITGRAGQLGRPRHGRCDRHTCVLWVICSRPPAIAMTMKMTMTTTTKARVTPRLIHATIFAAVLSPPPSSLPPER